RPTARVGRRIGEEVPHARHETSRVHHAARRRGVGMVARGGGAASRQSLSDGFFLCRRADPKLGRFLSMGPPSWAGLKGKTFCLRAGFPKISSNAFPSL